MTIETFERRTVLRDYGLSEAELLEALKFSEFNDPGDLWTWVQVADLDLVLWGVHSCGAYGRGYATNTNVLKGESRWTCTHQKTMQPTEAWGSFGDAWRGLKLLFAV